MGFPPLFEFQIKAEPLAFNISVPHEENGRSFVNVEMSKSRTDKENWERGGPFCFSLPLSVREDPFVIFTAPHLKISRRGGSPRAANVLVANIGLAGEFSNQLHSFRPREKNRCSQGQ